MIQEAARLGGIGSCGRELCCSTWLSDFRSVSTSAARYQQLKQLRKQVSQVSRKLETPSEVTEEVINTPEPIVVKEIKLKTGLYLRYVKRQIFLKNSYGMRM